MTREQAIKWLKEYKEATDYMVSKELEVLDMAISDMENIEHLKDRPCGVCEFNGENGCCKWSCVFCTTLFGGME